MIQGLLYSTRTKLKSGGTYDIVDHLQMVWIPISRSQMNTEMFHGDFELLNNCFKIKYNSLNHSKGEDFSKLTPPPKKKKFSHSKK